MFRNTFNTDGKTKQQRSAEGGIAEENKNGHQPAERNQNPISQNSLFDENYGRGMSCPTVLASPPAPARGGAERRQFSNEPRERSKFMVSCLLDEARERSKCLNSRLGTTPHNHTNLADEAELLAGDPELDEEVEVVEPTTPGERIVLRTLVRSCST